MKNYKILKVRNNWNTYSMEIMIPKFTWFNAAYNIRGKLFEAREMTLSQFLTVSNSTLFEVFSNMPTKQQRLFREFLRSEIDSKRGKIALSILDRTSGNEACAACGGSHSMMQCTNSFQF